MKRRFNPEHVPAFIALEQVSVASPCHADWNAMSGDERSRFCPSCAKNVYNLSAMTRTEAEGLLRENEGRLCVRYFQREDGTMLTQDCPVGAAALRLRSPAFRLWAGVASLLVLAGMVVLPAASPAQAQPELQPTPSPSAVRMGDVAPLVNSTPSPQLTATPSPTPPSVRMGEPVVIGKIAPPATKSTPSPPVIMGRMVVPRTKPKTTKTSKTKTQTRRHKHK